jgi:hypothetical protein
MMRLGADAGTAEDLAHETVFAVGRRAALFRAHNLRREVPWQELPPELLDRASSLPPEQHEVVALSHRNGRAHRAIAGDVADLDETVEHRPVADPPDCVWVASETPARFHRLFARLIQPLHGL